MVRPPVRQWTACLYASFLAFALCSEVFVQGCGIHSIAGPDGASGEVSLTSGLAYNFYHCVVGVDNGTVTYELLDGSGTLMGTDTFSNDCRDYQLAWFGIGGRLRATCKSALCAIGWSFDGVVCPCGSLCHRTSTADITAVTVVCSGGQYSLAGSTSCTDCVGGTFCPAGCCAPLACPAGSYCPPSTAAPVACPCGSYCPAGTSFPTTCGSGMYSDSGSTAVGQCVTCPCGKYCPPGSCSPSSCGPGMYSGAGAATATQCQGCPAGFSCPPNACNPIQCPCGHYCPATISSPLTCSGGTYNPSVKSEDALSCRLCSAGSHCPQSSCAELMCPCGSYCPQRHIDCGP